MKQHSWDRYRLAQYEAAQLGGAIDYSMTGQVSSTAGRGGAID